MISCNGAHSDRKLSTHLLPWKVLLSAATFNWQRLPWPVRPIDSHFRQNCDDVHPSFCHVLNVILVLRPPPPSPAPFFYIFLSVFFLRLYLQTCRPLSCKSDSYVSGELLLSESVDSSSIVVLQRWRKGRKRRRNRRRRRANNNNNQITSC